jgi:hypothetical protein
MILVAGECFGNRLRRLVSGILFGVHPIWKRRSGRGGATVGGSVDRRALVGYTEDWQYFPFGV